MALALRSIDLLQREELPADVEGLTFARFSRFWSNGRILTKAEWEKSRDKLLPSKDDGAYIASLMKPCWERGKYAPWIAAPKVTIKDSIAVQATPGLNDVKGVSRIISVPVVAYVNRAGFLRDGMLKVINAWMVHMRGAKKG